MNSEKDSDLESPKSQSNTMSGFKSDFQNNNGFKIKVVPLQGEDESQTARPIIDKSKEI